MTALKYVRISTKLHIHNRRLVLSQDHVSILTTQQGNKQGDHDASTFPTAVDGNARHRHGGMQGRTKRVDGRVCCHGRHTPLDYSSAIACDPRFFGMVRFTVTHYGSTSSVRRLAWGLGRHWIGPHALSTDGPFFLAHRLGSGLRNSGGNHCRSRMPVSASNLMHTTDCCRTRTGTTCLTDATMT